ncbi:hypothetical protein BJ138DRAFT_1145479 [Hygrophoropsis aurantiaca]|uniref:Uncharacterized protein n=1 Tax=Hygrophoropsis aurantiaca TaxID=72124 RepID=A0ACB8AK99_9AGAM|nr:hypothetical protein BJ138DRAFT_1145479 [Hygrophoropsis aurantiaca]
MTTMVMFGFVILASIISSAAAWCTIPNAAFGLSLAIYSDIDCYWLTRTDHHVYRGGDLAAEFAAHPCPCLTFPIPAVFSYTWQPGDYTEATLELWTGIHCDGSLYRETPVGVPDYESHVNEKHVVRSARICVEHDHKKPTHPHSPVEIDKKKGG